MKRYIHANKIREHEINTNAELVEYMKSKGHDTTMSEYELILDDEDRFGTGEGLIVKRFRCPGDYLAYFSLCLAASPTAERLGDYFGWFEEMDKYVDEYPTEEDIEKFAHRAWWGDGGALRLRLKNLTTGDVLYQDERYGDPTEEEDFEEWED